MKKIASTGLVIGAIMFGMVSCNQQQGAVEEAQQANEQQFEGSEMEERKMNQADFMTTAASNGMLEVQAGQLAQEKGQMQEIKNYGEKMVTDHTKANDELKTLASQKNITLPDSMGKDHMDKLQNLRDKTGAEFDQAYIDLMVSSHEDAVSLFEDASNNLEDTEVKGFASSTLPTLREHLDSAKQIQENMNNNQ